MDYDLIDLEISDGVALLRLNRPEVLNSLNEPLIREIRSGLAHVSKDPAARALVLTGAGRGFCAGADLSGGSMTPGLSLGEVVAERMEELFNPLVRDRRTSCRRARSTPISSDLREA